jgi:hypothetical protein
VKSSRRQTVDVSAIGLKVSLDYIDATGDGNCYFNTLSLFMFGDEKQATALRKAHANEHGKIGVDSERLKAMYRNKIAEDCNSAFILSFANKGTLPTDSHKCYAERFRELVMQGQPSDATIKCVDWVILALHTSKKTSGVNLWDFLGESDIKKQHSDRNKDPNFESLQKSLSKEKFSKLLEHICELLLQKKEPFDKKTPINMMINAVDLDYANNGLDEQIKETSPEKLIDQTWGENGVFVAFNDFGSITANLSKSPLLAFGENTAMLAFPDYGKVIYASTICSSGVIPKDDFDALHNYINAKLPNSSPLLDMLTELGKATVDHPNAKLACEFFQQLLKTLNAQGNGLPVMYYKYGQCGGHYSPAAFSRNGSFPMGM